ncbi:septum formation initiator family protein [bacterium]|nr:septum formation initiator family protein [bacterium]
MRKRKTHKRRKQPYRVHIGWILALCLLFTLVLALSFGKRGFIQQRRVNQQKDKLTNDIKILEAEKIRLEEEKEKLKTPEYTEKIAREKYGMAKENEKVYKVVPKK